MWTAENRARYNGDDVRNLVANGVMYVPSTGCTVAIHSHHPVEPRPESPERLGSVVYKILRRKATRRDPSRSLRQRSLRGLTSACTSAAEEASLKRERTCRSPECKGPQKTGH